MVDQHSLIFKCTDSQLIDEQQHETVLQLPHDVRRQFGNAYAAAIFQLDRAEACRQLNGLSVAEIIARFGNVQEGRKIVESGEQGDAKYTLYEAPTAETAVPESHEDETSS